MEHDVRELGELDLNKLILVVYEEIKDEELRAMIFSLCGVRPIRFI